MDVILNRPISLERFKVMKKLNRTELGVITKKIIAGIKEKHEEEERAFLSDNASDIKHWKDITMFAISDNPCLSAHFSGSYLEKNVETLAIIHVKKLKGYIEKKAPYSTDVFNALILAQIESPDLETLIQTVMKGFIKA